MRFIFIFVLTLVFAFSAAAQKSPTKPLAETFTATSVKGDVFDLAELKGKVILITFWSTKCPICVAEIPNLNKLAAQYAGREVVFLAPTMNNAETIKGFLKKKPFEFDILPDSFGLVLKYAERDDKGRINMAFPSYFLINQDGGIELRAEGFDRIERLDAEISRLLKAGR